MHPAPEGANSFIYMLLVFAHIMSAMMAIGFNFTYIVWIRRGQANPETLPSALKGVKFIDDFLANPLYIAAGVTGLLMILLMGKSVASFLVVAIVIYLIDIIVGALLGVGAVVIVALKIFEPVFW